MSMAGSGFNSPTLSLAGTVAPPNMDGVMELMDVLKRTMEQLGVCPSYFVNIVQF
jgi:hypothetical protein